MFIGSEDEVKFYGDSLERLYNAQKMYVEWFFKVSTGYFALLYGTLFISDKLITTFPDGRNLILLLLGMVSLVFSCTGILTLPNLDFLDKRIAYTHSFYDKSNQERMFKHLDPQLSEETRINYKVNMQDYLNKYMGLYLTHKHILYLICGMALISIAMVIFILVQVFHTFNGWIFTLCLLMVIAALIFSIIKG
jgi:hypothetical protein